ncbi:hypothetical protein [Klebsiella quasivariicola]|uniref:hypothetical protein n=1 Tax=Klebsiella quasivariicola TaxID=2026240 RepID=UPI00247923E9|nr:hypothetical protein [Klebsiella quasivariicola]
MKRDFVIYQRRDGFQIAQEKAGEYDSHELDLFARPHKGADWCSVMFDVDLESGYELIGEEKIECSRFPAQAIDFVDGVMSIFDTYSIWLTNCSLPSVYKYTWEYPGPFRTFAKSQDEAFEFVRKNWHNRITDFSGKEIFELHALNHATREEFNSNRIGQIINY